MRTMSKDMEQMPKRPIVICGSARSGKTTLLNLLRTNDPHRLVMPFEGLFPQFLGRWSLHFPKMHYFLANEYLSRRRFINEQKSKSISPNEFLNRTYNEEAPCAFKRNHLLQIINSIFYNAAHRRNRASWSIADLHAEIYYKRIRSRIPNILMLFVIRNPIESICASLYWQSFPKAINNKNKWFNIKLMQWILSAHIARRLKTQYPNDILVTELHHLLQTPNSTNGVIFYDNNPIIKHAFSLNDNWCNNAPDRFWYDYQGHQTFWCPGGAFRQDLLSDNEIYLIKRMTSDIFNFSDDPSVQSIGNYKYRLLRLTICKKIILIIANISPSFAFHTISWMFYPRREITTCFSKLKTLVRDLLYSYVSHGYLK